MSSKPFKPLEAKAKPQKKLNSSAEDNPHEKTLQKSYEKLQKLAESPNWQQVSSNGQVLVETMNLEGSPLPLMRGTAFVKTSCSMEELLSVIRSAEARKECQFVF